MHVVMWALGAQEDTENSLDDRQWIWNRYGTCYRAMYTLYEA